MGRKKQKSTSKGIKIFSGALALTFLSVPVLLLNGAPTSAITQTATTKVNVTIDQVIAVFTPTNINIDITPTASGQFKTGNGNVKVFTNNVKGYTTYITSNSTDTALKQSGVVTAIPSVSSPSNSISGTAWGWSNDAAQFKPVKAVGATDADTVFSRTNVATPTGDTKVLTVGASATNSVPSGSYTNTLLLTAVTNN